MFKEQYANSNLTTIGLQAGYYDQAHFISDFKAFAGLSPKDFRCQTTELKDFLKTLVLVNCRKLICIILPITWRTSYNFKLPLSQAEPPSRFGRYY